MPSTWNYRVMMKKESDGSPYFEIHEVYYDDNDVPNGYTDKAIAVGSDEGLNGLRDVLNRMLGALDKPILMHGDDNFPQIYNS